MDHPDIVTVAGRAHAGASAPVVRGRRPPLQGQGHGGASGTGPARRDDGAGRSRSDHAARTWLDLARTTGELQLVLWADWLFHPAGGGDWNRRPLSDPGELRSLLDRHRGKPGIRTARRAVSLLSGGLGSLSIKKLAVDFTPNIRQ